MLSWTGGFTRLRLTHLIPAAQLEKSYLIRLVEGLSGSIALFDSIQGHLFCRPLRSQRLYDFCRHLRRGARKRRFLAAKARSRVALAEIEAHAT